MLIDRTFYQLLGAWMNRKNYLAIKHFERRKDLLDRINKAVEEIKKDGTEAKMMEKWMGSSK